MSTEPAPRSPSPAGPPLAPLGHTAALVGLMLAVAITGTLLQLAGSPEPPATAGLSSSSSGRIWGQYLPLLLVNGALVLYVARLFRTRNVLPQLLGRPWRSASEDLAVLLYDLLAFVLFVSLEALTRPWFAGRNAAVSALLPSTEAERLTWLLVASTVGVCEEIVFRGYLQAQLSAFTRSALLGVLLQALLFGGAHLEQGAGAALRIGAYGLILGALAQHRRSLLPGIVCHVAIDLVSGLLG